MENHFTQIDLQTWPQAQEFYYYTQMASTSYTVNVLLDVTNTRKALKAAGYKFFPAYLWLMTRAISQQEQFRVGVQDGTLGVWGHLTPAYPQFHSDDHTTSLLYTEFEVNFSAFHAAYLADTKQYGASHGILSAKGVPPASSYIISCIPWFSFESFSLHNHGIKDYYFPSFEAGAFREENGRIWMPLSVTVHHATVDGWHLKTLFEDVQSALNEPENWMGPC
ncbi:MAG: CatA-like O-acetyltransferase [Oscillibacter sp.]|jgi:chloramphenicol O-acetyltransferase type A|nr:CatA-like O-acetyltransferase [Oscillibacter sp.]